MGETDGDDHAGIGLEIAAVRVLDRRADVGDANHEWRRAGEDRDCVRACRRARGAHGSAIRDHRRSIYEKAEHRQKDWCPADRFDETVKA